MDILIGDTTYKFRSSNCLNYFQMLASTNMNFNVSFMSQESRPKCIYIQNQEIGNRRKQCPQIQVEEIMEIKLEAAHK